LFEARVLRVFRDSYNAISREKQLKAGSRRAKIKLIEAGNPEWRDLFGDLCGWNRIATRASARSR